MRQARSAHRGGLVVFAATLALTLAAPAQAQIAMGIAGPFSGPNAATVTFTTI